MRIQYINRAPLPRMRAVAALLVVTALLFLSARARAATIAVSAIDLDFSPRVVTVHPGDTVVWTNAGAIPHTVTSAAAGFDSGLLQPGQTFAFTFTAPGAFAYVCTLHPGMAGTVVVQAAAPSLRPAPADAAPMVPTRSAPAASAPQAPSAAVRAGAGTAVPVPTSASAQGLPAAGTGSADPPLAGWLPELLLGSLALCVAGKLLLRRR
jgi:plastocyanin